MKNKLLFLPLLVLAFGLTSCRDIFCVDADGPMDTQEFPVDQFTGVQLEVPAIVTIEKGSTYSVTVTANEEVQERLQIQRKSNNRLEIKLPGCVRHMDDIRIHLVTPEFDYVSISGSGSVTTLDTFDVQDVDLRISGSGDITYWAHAASIESKISGSGDILIEGETNRQEVRISGSGSYFGFPLRSNEADIHISGSGKTEVAVADKLEVDISGSGDVFYKGDPEIIDVNISGSGNVTHVP